MGLERVCVEVDLDILGTTVNEDLPDLLPVPQAALASE